MTDYKIVLSERGKQVYKGGNINPMSKAFATIRADNILKAKRIFNQFITTTLGSGSMNLYKLEEVK